MMLYNKLCEVHNGYEGMIWFDAVMVVSRLFAQNVGLCEAARLRRTPSDDEGRHSFHSVPLRYGRGRAAIFNNVMNEMLLGNCVLNVGSHYLCLFISIWLLNCGLSEIL